MIAKRKQNSRQFPRNVILRAETFPALEQGGKVSWSHHTVPGPGRADNGQRTGEFGLDRTENPFGVIVVVVKRSGIGYASCQHGFSHRGRGKKRFYIVVGPIASPSRTPAPFSSNPTSRSAARSDSSG